MIWFSVPALAALATLVLYFDFRRQRRTPGVDALLGGAGVLVCLALWGWVPALLFAGGF